MSNFIHYTIVSTFFSAQLLNKIEELKEKALRFLLKDYGSTYEKFLEKSSCSIMNFRRKRTLGISIYKTLNKLNPAYINCVFKPKSRHTNS